MTHTRLLLALALVAAAVLVYGQRIAPTGPTGPQEQSRNPFCTYDTDGKVLGCLNVHGSGGRIPRPRNGECPVCGTMAKPYKVRTCPEGQLCPVPPEGLAPNFRRVDCAHCNATFRQWAEGKEPQR